VTDGVGRVDGVDVVEVTDALEVADGVRSAAPIVARRAGLIADVRTVGLRALRGLLRDPEAVVPPLIVGAFFYLINIGTLQVISEASAGVVDYKAFQLPTALIFGTTGLSRAASLVTDIQSGYFDRLLLTPVRRPALLLGLLVADFTLGIAVTVPIIVFAMAIGVSFATGVLGVLALVLMVAFWSMGFAGISYAVALKTGSAAAVNSTFLIFFPFAFLTTSSLPKEALTGWLAAIVSWNPVTYVLAGQRALVSGEWGSIDLLWGVLAIGGVSVVSLSMAGAALRGRVKRG